MTFLRWIAVSSTDGSILGEMPNLIVDQALKQTISQSDTASVKLPVVGKPGPPVNWMRITKPYASAFIALDGSDTSTYPQPLWGGITQQRSRDSNPVVSVPLATAESYLSRRFIRDTLQYPAGSFGVCQVGADLLSRYVVEPTSIGTGLPMRVVRLDNGIGQDFQWQDSNDKTVYSAFQDLGFEWTVSWEWKHAPERITPVLTLGSRIGFNFATSGLDAPMVTFSYGAQGGNLQNAAILEDYTDGKGANDVMASSTGSGSVRPQSAHQVAVDLDRPTVEDRYSAGSNLTSLAALNADAAADLATLKDGASGITLTGLYGRAPAFGRRWGIGDDVGYDVQGPQFPEHPTGVVRAIGVSFDPGAFTPVVAGN